MRRFAVLLAAATMAAACDDSTSPPSVPFALAVTNATTPGAPAPQFIGTSGAIVIRARFITPTPCFDLAAALRLNGSTLDATVTASARPGGACVQSLGTFDYTLTASPIAPGTYHIIVHHVGDANFSNTTFTGDVTVP
jgi:hypothetical protein